MVNKQNTSERAVREAAKDGSGSEVEPGTLPN